MNMNEPPSLPLRNDYRGGHGWITLELEGTRSNRAGLGATVVVTDVGERKQARAVLSQTSYYSHDDLRLHFGLGAARAGRRDRGDLAQQGRVDCSETSAGGAWSRSKRGPASREVVELPITDRSEIDASAQCSIRCS